MKNTKTLRDFVNDVFESKQQEEGLRDRTKKVRAGAKKAGSKVAKAIKWLTADSLMEKTITTEGVGDIVEFQLVGIDELPSLEAFEVGEMLGVPLDRIVGTNSKMNPTLYTKYRKILTSKHWVEQSRSDIVPEIAAVGQLTCLVTGMKFQAIGAYFDDGNTTPYITYFYDANDSEKFSTLISNTFLT